RSVSSMAARTPVALTTLAHPSPAPPHPSTTTGVQLLVLISPSCGSSCPEPRGAARRRDGPPSSAGDAPRTSRTCCAPGGSPRRPGRECGHVPLHRLLRVHRQHLPLP